MSDTKKLFLLDAFSLIYRSYYAFMRNPMYNAEGFNTSCVFGFLNTLEDVFNREKPTHIAVVFDPSGDNFRHAIYPEYKANREETPEEIRKSLPVIHSLLDAYRIQQVLIPNYEADDIIGTLAKSAQKDGYQVYMMTPDKDYIQLLGDNIFMYKPSRNGNDAEIWNAEKACGIYGIDLPEHFIDILALMGDSSDNIPGAPGIGEKTAMKLIGQYKTIDNLYLHIDDLKGKVKETILENKAKIDLSKVLATIDIHVPVDLDMDAFQVKDPDIDQIREHFEKLNFKNLEKRISVRLKTAQAAPIVKAKPKELTLFDLPEPVVPAKESNYASIGTIDHTYHLIQNEEDISLFIQDLDKQKEFCFDTETTSLQAVTAKLVGISFCWKDYEAYYIPVPENPESAAGLLLRFKPIFEREGILKIGQNCKFDILVLKKYGIDVKGPLFDTMLAHYILQPEQRHNMNYLAEQLLNYSPVSIETLIGEKGRGQLSMRDVDLEKIKEYAAEDADITWQLYQKLSRELLQFNLVNLAETIENPLVLVLAYMENAGVSLDTAALKGLAFDLASDIELLEQKIYAYAGKTFNIGSPLQLGKILFEDLKIEDKVKMTKTKQYATGEEVLEQLKDKHPIVNLILEYRGLKKLLNTYVDALPKMILPETGKIHTSFLQAVTSTGRLSSVDPNLQNIPIRDARGREIRKAFIPSGEKRFIVSADYSQIELRIMAHLSQDKAMIDAFRHNADIHTATAAKIYGITEDQVTRDMRSRAKTANFGIIYGISSFGLAQRLSISRKEASDLIEGYFTSFPGVKLFMDNSIRIARSKGYVETMFGRRRYLPEVHSNNATVRGMAERNAINSPIQGSAADIIKIAMISVYNAFLRQRVKSTMIIQVHDELVFDVLEDELELVTNLIRKEMEGAVALQVPLLVDIGHGKNWFEAH